MSARVPDARTAHHEAGHAVVALWERVGLRRVTIIADPAEGTLGHALVTRWPPSIDPETDGADRVRWYCERRILVSLAGVIAERRVGRRHNWIGATSDIEFATDLMLYLVGSGRQLAPFSRWMRARTEDRVELLWPQIARVADALARRLTLSHREVVDLLRAQPLN